MLNNQIKRRAFARLFYTEKYNKYPNFAIFIQKPKE